MRAVLGAAAAALGVLIGVTAVHAEDPVIVDLRIDSPAVVTVGDRITYTIVVEVDPGTPIALAAASLPPEVALVDTPETTRAPLSNGREQVTVTFQLAPFVGDDVFLPPLTLRYSNPDGTVGFVETETSVIEVTSVLPSAGSLTPRDLKPQAVVGTAPPTWPLPLLGALLALLLFLIIAAIVRRRFVRFRIARALRAVPVFTGPEDVARNALDAAGAKFGADGDLIAYYTAIGNAVRHYLTQRYGFPAFALTTRELESEMMRLGIDRWQVRVAGGLLAQCDAVVYARYRPAAVRADADLTAAYEIVEISRPEEGATTQEGVPVA
jgi:hypothetical protein